MHEFNCAAILEFSYFNLVSVLTNKIYLYNTLGRFDVLKREITNARIFYYFTLLRYFLTLENIIKPARRSILQIFRKATKAGLTLFQHYPQTAAARIFKERSCGTLL